MELLEITRALLEAESDRRANASDERNDPNLYDIEVDFDKLRQIKEVLEEGQHFSGINRFGREKGRHRASDPKRTERTFFFLVNEQKGTIEASQAPRKGREWRSRSHRGTFDYEMGRGSHSRRKGAG